MEPKKITDLEKELEQEILSTASETIKPINSNFSIKKEGEFLNHNPLSRAAGLLTDEDYIKSRLDEQMNWYDRKSSFNQVQYKKYKYLEFVIAATIPVLISISSTKMIMDIYSLHMFLQLMAASGGVVLVIINKVLELDEYHKNWKEYRVTSEALRHEKFLYLTRSEPYDESDAFPRLVSKIEAILNNEQQKWTKVAKKEEQPKKEENVEAKH